MNSRILTLYGTKGILASEFGISKYLLDKVLFGIPVTSLAKERRDMIRERALELGGLKVQS